jgi:hypothetical protein
MRMTADDVLIEAVAAQAKGALLVDIRGDDQRRAGGLIPGALVLPRDSLGGAAIPRRGGGTRGSTIGPGPLILICNQGC